MGPPPARVVVAEVRQAELNTRQTFVGTVMPSRSSTVGSPVEGLVVELMVEEGDHVEKGAPLAQLRDQQLRLQLAAAEAQLQVRRHELAESNISLPEEIEQADARMMSSKALMEFAFRRLQRTRKLVASRTISEDELQERESIAVAAQEKYRETKTAWQQTKAVWPVKIQQAEARLDAQQKEIDRLNDEVAQHKITAPFDGYVTEEHTEVGQWIAKGDPVVEVVELDTVEVEVHVPESCLSQLHVEITATVTIGALPGESWQQPVTAIVPKADVRSRSFPVKVRLKNRPGPGGVLLKPGMFARVTLPVASTPQALLVPKDAVVLGGTKPVVFVMDPTPKGPPSKNPTPHGSLPDGTARKVPVELGEAVDDLIEVRGPLKPGDLVVVEGNERLSPGQPLIVVRPPPAAKAPKSDGL